MSTTFYSSSKTISSGVYIRAKCVYETSQSNTAVTVKGTIYLQHKGAAYSNDVLPYRAFAGFSFNPSNSYAVWADSKATAKVSSYSKHTAWTDVKSASFSFGIDRGDSAATGYLVASVDNMYPDDDVWAKKAITIPALVKYAISYDANGGSGAPSSQSKVHGTDVKLSSVKPARNGYEFIGWATSSSATAAAYKPGATYTGNANLQLYAVWRLLPTVDSLSVTRVDASGNEDAMGAYLLCSAAWKCDAAAGGSTMTFSCDGVTANVSLSGASGNATATLAANARADVEKTVTATVEDGEGRTASGSVTSKTDYSAPRIVSVLTVRTDAAGRIDDEGTWVNVIVEWQCAHIGSQEAPSSLSAAATASGSTYQGNTTDFSGGAVSGNVVHGGASFMLGDTSAVEGPFDVNEQYTVRVTFSDSINTVRQNDLVTTAYYPWDVLGDRYLYNRTRDTAPDPEKTYYTRSGYGTAASPYVYTEVESPDASWMILYFEANGERPAHGISFGEACTKEGFNVSMPPMCYKRADLPVYLFASEPTISDVPYCPCLAIGGGKLCVFDASGNKTAYTLQ